MARRSGRDDPSRSLCLGSLRCVSTSDVSVTARLLRAGVPPDSPSPCRREPPEGDPDVFSRSSPRRSSREHVERSLGDIVPSVGARVLDRIRSPARRSRRVGQPFSRRCLRCSVRHHPRASSRSPFGSAPPARSLRLSAARETSIRIRVGAVRQRPRSVSTDVCNPLLSLSKRRMPLSRLGALRIASHATREPSVHADGLASEGWHSVSRACSARALPTSVPLTPRRWAGSRRSTPKGVRRLGPPVDEDQGSNPSA